MRHLAFIVSRYIRSDVDKSIASLRQLFGDNEDEAIGSAIMFKRNWIAFDFPRYVTLICDVFNEIAQDKGLNEVSFDNLLAAISSPRLKIMESIEEYGLPIEISRKLPASIFQNNLDTALSLLKKLQYKSIAKF